MKIEDLKQGDLFKRTPTAKKSFIKGAYNRSAKAYECTDYEDISNFINIKKGKEVFESED